MSIGERIRSLRMWRQVTQKQLGLLVGYSEKGADVRIAQYESGNRKPKDEVVKDLAFVMQISEKALKVPDIDSDEGLMHTLFALEDICGLEICEKDGRPCLMFNAGTSDRARKANNSLKQWLSQRQRLQDGEISRQQYDEWRYRFPAANPDGELIRPTIDLNDRMSAYDRLAHRRENDDAD